MGMDNRQEYFRYLDNNFGDLAVQIFNGSDIITLNEKTATLISEALVKINNSDSELTFKTKNDLASHIINKYIKEEIQLLTEGSILHPAAKKYIRKKFGG